MTPARVVARFTLPGEPVPKQRPRITRKGAYTPTKTTNGEQAIGWAFKAAARAHRPDGAVYGLDCRFVTGDRRRVDVDNLLKLVCDGLNGIAWLDDSQVWDVACSRQVDPGRPRTEVVVYLLGDGP